MREIVNFNLDNTPNNYQQSRGITAALLVPKVGLEPTRLLGSRDFKSLASAYSATPAE